MQGTPLETSASIGTRHFRHYFHGTFGHRLYLVRAGWLEFRGGKTPTLGAA